MVAISNSETIGARSLWSMGGRRRRVLKRHGLICQRNPRNAMEKAKCCENDVLLVKILIEDHRQSSMILLFFERDVDQ